MINATNMKEEICTKDKALDLLGKVNFLWNEVVYLDPRSKNETAQAKSYIMRAHVLVDAISSMKGNKYSTSILEVAANRAKSTVEAGCKKFDIILF